MRQASLGRDNGHMSELAPSYNSAPSVARRRESAPRPRDREQPRPAGWHEYHAAVPLRGARSHDLEHRAAGYGDARASDADRERAIDVLKAAFAEGRLTREEHGARVQRACGARTYAELAALSADLPAGPLGALPSQAAAVPAAYLCAASRRTNPLAVASLVCGLIPLLPATLAAIILGIAARRQIRRTGERGTALATAGLALGALWIVLTLIVLFGLQ
jgi:Domain of unknown function (DUF1707)/Domain of unknown function (DUF4190)